MLASVLNIGFSLLLFVYWFRASCRLLLRSYSEEVMNPTELVADRFRFPQVQAMLQTGHDLDPLHRWLNHDFQLLTYLRQHAANIESGSFEDQLLILDYKMMRWYFRIMSKVLPSQAHNALSEMATVVGVLAQKMGAQAGV